MTLTGNWYPLAKMLARLHILRPTYQLWGVFGRGGERSCHRSFILTSGHIVVPENTSALMPNG